MRSKENAQDYRFLPEVDLPKIIIDDKLISKIKSEIPQLPQQKRDEYKEYNFDDETIEVLISNLYLTKIFDDAIKKKLKSRRGWKIFKKGNFSNFKL